MAETDRFRSNLRKEPRSAGGTRDRRKMFEDTDNSASNSGASSVASRYSRSTSDRNDSPSSTSRGTTSVTSRFNRMNIDDDDKKEEEEERRPVKKYGGSSIANRINKSNADDEAEDGDSEKEKEEEEAPKKKPIKKATTAKGQKRKDKKNLREKRRSTGVVIMPGQPVAAGDAEQREVAENTARNMGEDESASSAQPSEAQMEAAKQNETIIEELKEELAKAHRELDKLQADNLRLKDENSALLRVVGSLSGTRR